MKDYLVDVPVKVNIWTRPECQKKQFEIIKKARPSILFVTSDGGRNEHEWDLINQNRKLYDEGIDWNCTVYKIYMDTNLGMYAMARKREEFIWSKVDRCIFLEDDQLPSVSYFKYCEELLEKYKDDTRIECICGVNHLGVHKQVTADYFFSRQGSIWGIASWKRVWEERNMYDYYSDTYVSSLLKKRTEGNRLMWKQICEFGSGSLFNGHVAGSEFWIQFNMYAQNRLQIIPKYNLISNIGCGEGSTHSKETLEEMSPWKRRIFHAQLYDMHFPLRHPKYVIPDEWYERERNKIMNKDYAFGVFRERLYHLYYHIKKGDIKWMIKKLCFWKHVSSSGIEK